MSQNLSENIYPEAESGVQNKVGIKKKRLLQTNSIQDMNGSFEENVPSYIDRGPGLKDESSRHIYPYSLNYFSSPSFTPLSGKLCLTPATPKFRNLPKKSMFSEPSNSSLGGNSKVKRATNLRSMPSTSTPQPYRKSNGTLRQNIKAKSRVALKQANSTRVISCPNTPISSSFSSQKGDVEMSEDDLDIAFPAEESSRVTVGVRVRPINTREMKNPNVTDIIEMNENEVCVHHESGTVYSFNYDHCMWSCSSNHKSFCTQEDVYKKMARPLLDHAYEGYNVCVFAYGQTGSGKSYCIMGEGKEVVDGHQGVSLESGIIPRFCLDLFNKAEEIISRKEKTISYKVIVEVSYVEIYNEKIYDLIGCECSLNGIEKNPECKYHQDERKEALRVREHPETGPYISGAAKHLVASYSDVLMWINLGNKKRSISATGMNDRSSRAHSLFSLTLTQSEVSNVAGEIVEQSFKSTVNLIDLAGTERVAASNPELCRFKEGVSINQSLLTLSKVIAALGETSRGHKPFIAYRESVLTWLLKDSLGGNSKTAVIATVSPCNIHQEETLSTMRFACLAQKIINWSHVNENSTSRVIRVLKQEIEQLKSQNESRYCSNNEEVVERRLEGLGKRDDIMMAGKDKEIKILQEKLKIAEEGNAGQMRLYEEKLKESEQRQIEAIERCKIQGLSLKMEEDHPTLVNLCEDPQLSQALIYAIKNGSTSLGQNNADVVLKELHEQNVHCSILYDGEKLTLHPVHNRETFVNGRLVLCPTEVFHNDRIVLSGIYYFRLCFPANRKPENEQVFDFFFARDEVLRSQEERLREELLRQWDKEKVAMKKEMEEERLLLTQQNEEMTEEVNILSTLLEKERHEVHDAHLTQAELMEEKNYLENQLQRSIHRQSSVVSDTSSPFGDSNFFQQVQSIFNESFHLIESSPSQVNLEDVEKHIMIKGINRLCQHLKKPYEFQGISKLTGKGIEHTFCVCDVERNLTAPLVPSQLKEAYRLLSDIVSGHQEDADLFETGLLWERSEEVSRLPYLLSRLKNSASRRASLGDFPAHIRKRQGLLRKSSLSNSPFEKSDVRRTLAKAYQVLLIQEGTDDRQETLSHEIVNKAVSLRKAMKESLMTIDDIPEFLSLCLSIHGLMGSVNSLSSICERNALSPKVNFSLSEKIRRKVMQLMQAIGSDSQLLIEESCSGLCALILELVECVAMLTLCTRESLVSANVLVLDPDICHSYLKGVCQALERQVEDAAKSAAEYAKVFQIEVCLKLDKSLADLIINTVQCVTNFLDKFSQLKVSPSLPENFDSTDLINDISKFQRRVSASSDSLCSLLKAFKMIRKGLTMKHKSTIYFNNSLNLLRESVEELAEEAHVGSSFRRHLNSMTDDSTSEATDLLLKTLHQEATNSLKAIEALRAVTAREGDTHPAPAAVNRFKSPKEKKVRFDISLESTFQ